MNKYITIQNNFSYSWRSLSTGLCNTYKFLQLFITIKKIIKNSTKLKTTRKNNFLK